MSNGFCIQLRKRCTFVYGEGEGIWQRPCAINSCTWHGPGSSSLSVQACQDASLFSVIIIFLLTATGKESVDFFSFLSPLLFFLRFISSTFLWHFLFSGCCFLWLWFSRGNYKREPWERERRERDRRTTVMRVRCLANTGYELEDADESSLYAIFHFSLSRSRSRSRYMQEIV